MTNEELNALVRDAVLAADCMQEIGTFETGQGILHDCARAITTLRAQLAEAQRLMRLDRTIADKNADRADRAEAALAAQIEVDASSNQERNYLHLHDAAYSVWKWFQIARPDLIGPRAERLRDAVIGPRPYGDTQPHDRTALDRHDAKTREKALREAANSVQLGDTVQSIQRRILALIEKPNAR